ncbi:AAA domain-containing protein [Nocardiopsis kunsanensis]
MRSLQDEEAPTAAGAVAEPGAGPMPTERSGVGTASLRWKPSVDRTGVCALLAYLRTCVRREGVHHHPVREDHLGTDVCACLPAGPEPLFSGSAETLSTGPDTFRVVRRAQSYGQSLRYGYPLVLIGEGEDRAALPLLTVDVQSTDDPGSAVRSATPGARVRAVGPPDLNAALLARIGLTDPDDLFELRARLRGGGPRDARRPAAVGDLAAKIRALLAHLEIERVDDLVPGATRGCPRGSATGAHNVAVLFRAGPEEHPADHGCGPGGVTGLLDDLDHTDEHGLDPERVGGTALEALVGPPATENGRTVGGDIVPVSAAPLRQDQYDLVSSAMREQLTVALAPPGTGDDTAVDTLVRTAVTHGQRVLVCAHTDAELDRLLRRAETDTDHPVVRVGRSAHRGAEAGLLTRLLAENRGPRSTPARGEAATCWGTLTTQWERVRRAWNAMDTMASGGHELARLAEERARHVERGWDPDTLFTPERGGPDHWLDRVRRARGGGLRSRRHRALIRRELGVRTDPESLARLRELALLESRWRAAVDRRTRCAPLGELTTDLAEAVDQHRRAGQDCLTTVAEARLRRGRSAVENRLETLNWYRGDDRPGLSTLMDTLPAWACRTDHVRSLPLRAGLFDLVVVLGAERTRVCEAVPALYRAARAVVLGDPAHPGPHTALEPEEERRALTASGVSGDRLDEHGLRYGEGSALTAAAKAAPPPVWLTEQWDAPPHLARIASRHCYGGRLHARTVPEPARGPSYEWREAPGTCEAAPGASYVNREEAYRAAVVVSELDADLPPGESIAVVAPTQPQTVLLRRLLLRRPARREIRVGGPDLLTEHDADVTVLSPVLAEDAPSAAERRVRRMTHLWSAVLTRTRRRLVVVGDRRHWSVGDGPLSELAGGRGTPVVPDTAVAVLAQALRAAGTRVSLCQEADDRCADLVVRFGARRLRLLLDREPDGAALRHLMARGEHLNRTSGDPVVVVPAWRCIADRRGLVAEILSAH